jgi:hypothetical protein
MKDDTEDSRAEGLQLHRQCLEGEPTAQARLYELFAAQVCRILATRFPVLQANHPDWVEDAVADGLTDYLVHPTRYDPDKRSLLGYLVMLAEGDLRNRRNRETRQGWEGRGDAEGNFHFVSLDEEDDESVGMRYPDRNVDVEAEVLSALEEDGDFVSVLRRSIRDDDDWKVLQLLADGATGTADYVAALGLDVPADEMPDMAKHSYDHKERIRKRARRCWEAYKDGRQVRQYGHRSGDNEEASHGRRRPPG